MHGSFVQWSFNQVHSSDTFTAIINTGFFLFRSNALIFILFIKSDYCWSEKQVRTLVNLGTRHAVVLNQSLLSEVAVLVFHMSNVGTSNAVILLGVKKDAELWPLSLRVNILNWAGQNNWTALLLLPAIYSVAIMTPCSNSDSALQLHGSP